ncbi:hypothetical protein Poly30_09610 [Planctomycetes bacterium Poly30]|uniref:DUF4136 domain-containing protein n=1 Tax=Saltatorellus ferox TaxID=2528018 RepID=A0A518EMZ8_9BACT|nr:hypothetical protein Poly30_09610 [Planctomycetes bacterium Poly30]
MIHLWVPLCGASARIATRPLQGPLLGPLLALLLTLGGAAGSLGLAGCAGTEIGVQEAAPAVFEGERTYAWSGSPPEAGRIGAPADQEAVAAAFRRALDSALEEHGFRKVNQNEARFRAGLYLGVEKDVREADPQFTVYRAERIEDGHVVFTLTEGAAAAPAWTGTASRLLRVTERGLGQLELRWTGTEEVRDWQVERLAASLGARLP